MPRQPYLMGMATITGPGRPPTATLKAWLISSGRLSSRRAKKVAFVIGR